MINNTNYLVFQAYGLKDVMNEVLMSVASLYKVTKKSELPHIYIYTDSVDYLKKKLPDEVNYILKEKQEWENWKGERSFVHRAKIEMLRDFALRISGNILYCDTDTYFLQSPAGLYQQITNGSYIMHTDEGMLNGSVNKVFQKLERFLKNYSVDGIKISSDTHMWNAGVLGFTSEAGNVLDKVLSLSDQLYREYQKHVMEQLAFSYYFSEKARTSCESFIFHYWDFKEYRLVLADFFSKHASESFSEWQSEIESILPMDLIKEKQTFRKQPYWKQKLIKLFGK